VSRSAEGIVCPILYIASITSSVGIRDVTPANAISAEIIAFEAPAALRLTHGTSTRPATGSHTNPSMFFRLIANASADCCGVPSAITPVDAALIATADPTSASQQSAPSVIEALLATTELNAPVVNRK